MFLNSFSALPYDPANDVTEPYQHKDRQEVAAGVDFELLPACQLLFDGVRYLYGVSVFDIYRVYLDDVAVYVLELIDEYGISFFLDENRILDKDTIFLYSCQENAVVSYCLDRHVLCGAAATHGYDHDPCDHDGPDAYDFIQFFHDSGIF